MRKLPIVVIGIFALMVRSSAGTTPISFYDTSWSITQSIEQQNNPMPPTGPVVNPDGCIWNVNDYRNRGGSGTIDAGATATDQVCEIADWAGSTWMWAHVGYATFYSKSNLFTVRVTFSSSQTATATPTWIPSQRVYEYRACTLGPTYQPNDPQVQTIPNSNGGWGVPTTATLSITNTGARANTIDPGSLVWGITYGGGCYNGGVALYPPYN